MSTNPVRTRPLPVVTPRNSKTTTHCKLCYLVTDLWCFFCKKIKKHIFNMDFYTLSENIKCVIIFSRTQKLTIQGF